MKKVLKNDRVCLTVSDFGAEMTSLTLDGFEYLWSPDERYYNRTSPCLFPITGRFMDGFYTHNDKQYPMQLNGIAMEKTFTVTYYSETELTLELREDEDTLSVYPYPFTLVMNYRLDGQKLHITYTVTNRSDEPMPYSVGNHTAYRWPLMEDDNPNSYFLRFEQAETLESFSPFGWIAPWLTNERIRPLSHDLYVNGTRSFRDKKSEWLEYTGANCDFVVRMYSKEFPFVANWASNDENAKIICIEPSLSIASNGPTMFDRAGIHTLEAGCSETVSYTLELYRKSDNI
ncbi:MAG: hypothetical protein J6Q76_07300 [Clostridia bacterium]|nr:hypothetical protein [Clostridia bacterium]